MKSWAVSDLLLRTKQETEKKKQRVKSLRVAWGMQKKDFGSTSGGKNAAANSNMLTGSQCFFVFKKSRMVRDLCFNAAKASSFQEGAWVETNQQNV